MRKYLLLVAIVCSAASVSCKARRQQSAAQNVTMMNEKGEIYLLYSDPGEIIMEKCASLPTVEVGGASDTQVDPKLPRTSRLISQCRSKGIGPSIRKPTQTFRSELLDLINGKSVSSDDETIKGAIAHYAGNDARAAQNAEEVENQRRALERATSILNAFDRAETQVPDEIKANVQRATEQMKVLNETKQSIETVKRIIEGNVDALIKVIGNNARNPFVVQNNTAVSGEKKPQEDLWYQLLDKSFNPKRTVAICNQVTSPNASEPLYASIGFERDEGIQSDGWYKVDKGTCRTITIAGDRSYTGPIYVWAEMVAHDFTWYDNEATVKMCVHTLEKFSYFSKDVPCTAENQALRPVMKREGVAGVATKITLSGEVKATPTPTATP